MGKRESERKRRNSGRCCKETNGREGKERERDRAGGVRGTEARARAIRERKMMESRLERVGERSHLRTQNEREGGGGENTIDAKGIRNPRGNL